MNSVSVIIPLRTDLTAVDVRTLSLLTIACLLAGCGHRGPLYIPGKPGDPAFDRQNRGTVVPAPATNTLPPANDRTNTDEDGNR